MALSVPFTFGPLTGPIPLSDLDADFSAVTTWINARNPTVGPIASRPAAGNAGALWVASDQGFLVYADDGAAWDRTDLPGPNFLEYAQIAAPAAPASGSFRVYAPTTAATVQFAGKDSTGTQVLYGGVLSRALSVNVSNTVTETSFGTVTIKGGVLNELGRQLHLVIVGQFLNNSGGTASVTFKIKFGGVAILVVTTGLLAANALGRGVLLTMDLLCLTAGASGAIGATALLSVGGVGTAGTSTGVAATDMSTLWNGGFNMTTDNVLDVTATLSTATATISFSGRATPTSI